eukprot:8607204-Lingulodinium_polyedra.AAC.1
MEPQGSPLLAARSWPSVGPGPRPRASMAPRGSPLLPTRSWPSAGWRLAPDAAMPASSPTAPNSSPP